MSKEQTAAQLTYGERMVRISFNTATDSGVDLVKKKHAETINFLKFEMDATDIGEEKAFFQRAINKEVESSMLSVYALTAKYSRG